MIVNCFLSRHDETLIALALETSVRRENLFIYSERCCIPTLALKCEIIRMQSTVDLERRCTGTPRAKVGQVNALNYRQSVQSPEMRGNQFHQIDYIAAEVKNL